MCVEKAPILAPPTDAARLLLLVCDTHRILHSYHSNLSMAVSFRFFFFTSSFYPQLSFSLLAVDDVRHQDLGGHRTGLFYIWTSMNECAVVCCTKCTTR